MCTDTFSVEYPQLFDFDLGHMREYRASASVSAFSVNSLIETIKDTLVAAGWFLEAKIAADGGIFMPGGFFDNPAQITLEGVQYGHGLEVPCSHVSHETNTVEGLGAAITRICSRYFARGIRVPITFVHGTFQLLQLVAGNDRHGNIDPDQAGTTGNEPLVAVPSTISPYYGGGPAVIGHGGYRLSSRVVFGSFDGTAPVGSDNVIMVEITETPNDGHVQFKFFNPGGERVYGTGSTDADKVFSAFDMAHGPETGGVSYSESFPYTPYVWRATGPNPTYALIGGPGAFSMATAAYRIIANPYQFAITDLANGDRRIGAAGNSILVSAPFVDPTKMPALLTCRAVIGPGQLMSSLVWGGVPSSFALNFFYRTFTNNFEGRPGIATGIYPFSQPLLATNGKPVIFNAYLMAPQEGFAYEGTEAGEATVIGKLWDGLVLSQRYTKGTRFSYDGHTFECVSTQSGGSVSSLFLAV